MLIDQLALPADERYVTCTTWREVAACIRDMTVRGAPAIGVAAAGALALAAREAAAFSAVGDRAAFDAALERGGGRASRRPGPRPSISRWAIAEMRALWQRCDAAPEECWLTLLARAREIHDDDIRRCSRHRRLRRAVVQAPATPSSRTATRAPWRPPATARRWASSAPATSATAAPISVFVDETRPWLQGARLTAWELGVEGIEYSVIADNMAGHFISRGEVDGIVVGADRIAANGDTANKIGTYTLSVLAKEHGVPFYVAAPLSTVDLRRRRAAPTSPSKSAIPPRSPAFAACSVAPDGAHARHPAFDVTPAGQHQRHHHRGRRAAAALRQGPAPGLPRRATCA